jgi:hypothetical protein
MNKIIGFFGSYVAGFAPSRIPPCGVARSPVVAAAAAAAVFETAEEIVLDMVCVCLGSWVAVVYLFLKLAVFATCCVFASAASQLPLVVYLSLWPLSCLSGASILPPSLSPDLVCCSVSLAGWL